MPPKRPRTPCGALNRRYDAQRGNGKIRPGVSLVYFPTTHMPPKRPTTPCGATAHDTMDSAMAVTADDGNE